MLSFIIFLRVLNIPALVLINLPVLDAALIAPFLANVPVPLANVPVPLANVPVPLANVLVPLDNLPSPLPNGFNFLRVSIVEVNNFSFASNLALRAPSLKLLFF